MGMYTELYLAIELDKNTNKDIIEFLNFQLNREETEFVSKSNHEFFKCSRSSSFGYMDSYYFDSIPVFKFRHDDISNSYFLTMVFNLKNYENEIEKFLDLINPYIISDGHIGHKRYEEQETPTILVFDSSTKKIIYLNVEQKIDTDFY